MSVARFVADQRTMHRVPHTVTCAILGISVSWFYKWVHREPTLTEVRRRELDDAVKAAFEASKRTYGSPRIHADLVEAGWTVSVNTVADSMRRQGLQGRKPKRRKGTTKQDKTAPKFETPWFRWRLGLLDFDQGLVGPFRSVEDGFELCGR